MDEIAQPTSPQDGVECCRLCGESLYRWGAHGGACEYGHPLYQERIPARVRKENYARRDPRTPGRLRLRMEELLCAAGVPCRAEAIWTQEGAYRIYGTESRWGVLADDGRRLACWQTMTECARNGITVHKEDRDGWVIYANEQRDTSGRKS